MMVLAHNSIIQRPRQEHFQFKASLNNIITLSRNKTSKYDLETMQLDKTI